MEWCDFSPPSVRGLNQKQLNWSSVVVNEYLNHGQDLMFIGPCIIVIVEE